MEESINDERQYVVFKLDTEVFGLEISLVREIIVYKETTRLPGIHHEFEGVINLRGHVIPVFCLRKKFGLAQKALDNSTRIVVVEVHGCTVGVIVDGVSEVLMIPASVIESTNSMITSSVDANFIEGIAKYDEKLIIVLNLEQVIHPSTVQTTETAV